MLIFYFPESGGPPPAHREELPCLLPGGDHDIGNDKCSCGADEGVDHDVDDDMGNHNGGSNDYGDFDNNDD